MTAQVSPSADHAALAQAVAIHRDQAAFTQLFDYYAPRLKSHLVRASLDPAAAEEITQEVMVTLWRKAALFDPAKASLATWLYRVARNCRIDSLRRQRAGSFDPLGDDYEQVDENQIAADVQMDAGQREDLLQHALKALPQEQMDLVRLAFFDGLTHSEIAARSGVPLGTVKSRIRLAFARLRKALADVGVVEAG